MKNRIACMLIALAVFFSMSVATAPTASAAVSYGLTTSSATTFVSTNDPNNQVKVTITSGGFKVSCKHQNSFEKMDIRLIPYAGGDYKLKRNITESDGSLAAGGSWTVSFDFTDGEVPDGKYWVFIYKYDPDDMKSKYLPFMRGPIIRVSNKTAKLMTYASVKKHNAAVSKTVTSPDPFKKKDLSDMKYLLIKDRSIKSSTESAYYKKVSNKIVATGDSKYVKARKIFAWVSKKFYYDYDHTAADAFDDPYLNLKHQQERLSDTKHGNALRGKVALQCDGYAGIYCALVRSQGIPCRILIGRHSEPTSRKKWCNGKANHTWCEVYVNSKWITVDPSRGAYNSFKNGKYLDSPQVMYEYFDMTADALCLSHSAIAVGGVWKKVPKVAKPTVRKATSKKVKVTWKKVANADHYEIWYSSKKSSGYKKIATVKDVSSASVFMKQGWWYKVRGYGFHNATKIKGLFSTPTQYKP